MFLAGLIGGEDLARLVQLGIEYFPHPPAFARADLAEVTEAEKELVRAFERGPAMDRLETALVPWTPVIA